MMKERPFLTQITMSTLICAAADATAQRIERAFVPRAPVRSPCAKPPSSPSPDSSVVNSAPLSSPVSSSPSSSTISPSSSSSLPSSSPTDAHRAETEEDPAKLCWKRVVAFSAYGFAWLGPVGHVWYSKLDQWALRKWPHGSPKFLLAKIVPDTVIFGPLSLAFLFGLVATSEGRSFEQLKQQYRRDYIPTVLAEAAFWPLAQYFNFRFVPVPSQLLVVNLVNFGWASFLSYIQHNGFPFIGSPPPKH